jgi:hypothetical protein
VRALLPTRARSLARSPSRSIEFEFEFESLNPNLHIITRTYRCMYVSCYYILHWCRTQKNERNREPSSLDPSLVCASFAPRPRS